MAVGNKDLVDAILHPTLQVLEEEGVTLISLVKRHRRLLLGKKSVFIKMKGYIPEDYVLPRGVRMIMRTSDECLLEVKVVDQALVLKVLGEFYKLRGDYPAQKHNHKVDASLEIATDLDAAIEEMIDQCGPKPKKAKPRKKRRT